MKRDALGRLRRLRRAGSRDANNAAFGVLAAYNELVPAFERLFEREGRDFARFYAEVRRLAALPPGASGVAALER